MNDEFLHRLRKEPRPEFAARLQLRLRRQSTSPLWPRVPSRARTLLTLLLLGGTAFAVTTMLIKGLPASLLELYQHATVRIGAEPRAHGAGNEGIREGLPWGASGSSSPHGSALRSGGTSQPAAPAMSAQSAATSPAGSSGGSSTVGVPRSQIPQIRAVSSWAAYPYAVAIAERMNSTVGMPGAPIAPHIDVAIQHSGHWPGPICGGGARAPDLAFAFEPGFVSDRPCLPGASGSPSPVAAIPVGYEVLALARSPLYGRLDLTRREVFLALAKWVPDPARAAAVHENPNTTWRQLDPTRGPEPIEFLGPPLSSAAGRSMIQLLIEGGCNTYPWIAALKLSDPNRYARICRTVRTDGVYVEASPLESSRLLSEPNAIGIIEWGYASGQLVVSRLDGVEPTRQNIESGAYPGSRVFYLLINRSHIAPNVAARLVTDEGLYPDWTHHDWALIAPTGPELRAAIAQALGP